VLELLLAPPAHHHQIAEPRREPPGRAAAAPRSQQERAGCPEGDDRDDGLWRRAADAVAVPGHAVGPVAVEVQRHTTETDAVVATEQGRRVVEHRVRP